ncbi:MAG: hypothetical protein QNK23_04360 [Crocinitomicaceae bacterium]|nr:hypothetical protein [Crocinitomicaceae bacterium]
MKKSLYLLGLVVFITSLSFTTTAQRNVSDTVIGTPWISIHYGLGWSAGDLSDRMGLMNSIGAFAGYKTNKNWVFGVEGSFMFGNDVRTEGLFDHLVDSHGNITDINGDIAIVRVLARGWHANAEVGKIFPVLSPNKNSGIYLRLGLGYVSYNLRVETQDQVIPQIEEEYKKGYDRLTTGLNTDQFVGYAFMANQGVVNFYAGFYIQEGFTYNRRQVFYDQPDVPVPSDLRLDVQYGFRVAWLIPVYKRMPKQFYYN